MENFIFGIQNIAINIKFTILALLRHQLVWGFIIGFVGATVLYVFITSDTIRVLPYMLTRDAHGSFEKAARRSEDGTYLMSFSEYQKKHKSAKGAFYGAVITALVVVIISLLFY